MKKIEPQDVLAELSHRRGSSRDRSQVLAYFPEKCCERKMNEWRTAEQQVKLGIEGLSSM
jgi:hypothetical protein